jgi:hypothetical protein
MLGIKDWTSDTWTAVATIVAFAALVQPWLAAAWRRFFKAGTVDIYETGTFEIGFSAFGMTVAVTGTLRSRDRDMFIPAITVNLVKNGATKPRRFEWAGFRNAKALFATTAGQSAEVSLEAPAGFMVSTAQPYRYNIIFTEPKTTDQLRPIFETFRKAWLDYFPNHSRLDLNAIASDPSAQTKVLNEMRRVYQEFSATEPYGNAFDSLNQLLVWEAGTYELVFQVHTAGPIRNYAETWTFSLTEDEVNSLRNNVSSILEEVVQLPLTAGFYFFAYPAYR